MGLLNLQSIFEDELKSRSEDYIDQRPQHVGDPRFEFNVPVPGMSFADRISESPILDTLLRGRVYDPIRFSQNITGQKEFVVDINANNGTHPFQNETFDPRVGFAKPGTLYYNFGNTHQSATKDPLITFQNTNYRSLEDLGEDLGGQGWSTLYNRNHTPRDSNPDNDPNSPFQPYHYSSNVNRGKLDIRANNAQYNLFSPSRTPLAGLGSMGGTLTDFAGEPYIVSNLPTNSTDVRSGRFINAGSQEVPIIRALTDTVRIAKYLSSPQGLVSAALKNIYGNVIKTAVAPLGQSPYLGDERRTTKDNLRLVATGNLISRDRFSGLPLLTRITQQYNTSRFTGINITHNPLHTLLAVGTRVLGGGMPNIGGYGVKIESGGNFFDNNKYANHGTYGVWNSINGYPLSVEVPGIPEPATRSDIITTLDLDDNYDPNNSEDFDSYFEQNSYDDNSLPLYFIDLRDNKVIYFRGYLEGITENISPSWASENYVGRSEPVYIYERAERDLSFNLKLFAHTPKELEMIYKKIDRLTSMCYPEYAVDAFLGNQKQKMKPPLLKFRMGELFGRAKKELTGFIKSLTYTVPEESTWESLSDETFFGEKTVNRVPKYIIATVNYQVIHSTVPNLETAFYGYEKSEDSFF